ncbi:pentatricopeptide repeat-containing protein At2g13600 [Cryptomeria japonica]|uniref:pentatricopeptide repeat-containing protein At2g13600 n=1 Tax=Cryptomeria japonica TaxID=3369 RepID=UPI0027DA33A6|nr:pentatricopeptide repeat-containing protein At2g13600 [Cryptomeria japonica]
MYAKCGGLSDARKVFDDMTEPDILSWNVIIAAYQRHGCPYQALELFYQMRQTGTQPNQFIFASILPGCARMRALEEGMNFHQTIIQSGFLADVVIVNALIDMYVKCQSIQKARELFDKMPQRDAISWNSMISGYAQNCHFDEALKLFKGMPRRDVVSWTAIIAGYVQNGLVEKASDTFKQMQLAGVKSNSATFASILPACAKMGALDDGREIHQTIVETGFFSNVAIASALIDMYAKCGNIQKAEELFNNMAQRNVVSWTAMITGYAQNGFVEEALETFKQMQLAGMKPDSTTFASILAACAKKGTLNEGYAQSGGLDEALNFFKEMPRHDVISWTVLIAGYAQNGLVEKALETFKQMQLAGLKPNSTTFASIIPAFARMGVLEQGMEFHQKIIKSGFLSAVVAKARELFEEMSARDVVSWNAMIAGYAVHGYGKDALELFKRMTRSRTYPDRVSFICVLFACCHAGLVDEGCKYFNAMSIYYSILATDHYVCMVDLLGRAGYLEEALNFIVKMPIKPVEVVWMCLLGACRSHNDVKLGVFTATLLFDLDPKNYTPYVLLSGIYAEMGWWDDVQKIRRLMKERGMRKMPGYKKDFKLDIQGVNDIFIGSRYDPDDEAMRLWALYPPHKRPKIIDVEKDFGHMMKLKVGEVDPMITVDMGVDISKLNKEQMKMLVKEQGKYKSLYEELLRSRGQPIPQIADESKLKKKVEDAPIADNPPVEEENVAEPSSPVVATDEDFLVAEGATIIIEEKIVESSEEQPSTSLQKDLPVLQRKGKELERDEIDEELMNQP